jgi:hypothetical protein
MAPRAAHRASVSQQAFALARRFPDSRLRRDSRTLVWRGRMQPSPTSRSYLVEMKYRLGATPRVRVVSRLRTRTGESLPHVWNHSYRVLCLHERDDWNPRMLIADTTVPWAAEWLFFYELWLVTGEWDGGGHWPAGAGL